MSQWTLRTTRAFWSVTKRLNNPRHPIGHPEDTPRSGICAQSGFWVRRNLTQKRAASTSRALRVRTPLPSVADPPPPHLPPEMTRTEYVTVCVCMTGTWAATWGRSRGLMNPYLQEQCQWACADHSGLSGDERYKVSISRECGGSGKHTCKGPGPALWWLYCPM